MEASHAPLATPWLSAEPDGPSRAMATPEIAELDPVSQPPGALPADEPSDVSAAAAAPAAEAAEAAEAAQAARAAQAASAAQAAQAASAAQAAQAPAAALITTLTTELLSDDAELRAGYPVTLDLSAARFCLDGSIGEALGSIRADVLRSLQLDANALRSLEGIERFGALRSLSACRNALAAAAPRCARLEQLALGGNRLRALPTLAGCPVLRTLELDANQINGGYEQLKYVPKLSRLDLRYNQVCGGCMRACVHACACEAPPLAPEGGRPTQDPVLTRAADGAFPRARRAGGPRRGTRAARAWARATGGAAAERARA